MTDNLRPEIRRRTMQAVKGKDTKLELRLFSMLARMGLRGWKKHVDGVYGKPDAAFAGRRVAVFVDGCFWHGCPRCRRPLPAANGTYWKRKIARNKVRDRTNDSRLRRAGWTVVRIMEHEMTDRSRVRSRMLSAIGNGE